MVRGSRESDPKKGNPYSGECCIIVATSGLWVSSQAGKLAETNRRWRSAVLPDLPPPKKKSLCENTLSGFDVRLPRDITSNERGERRAE